MRDTQKTTLYCSFCGKSQHEVKKLIAGPATFICDECIDLCNSIIAEANAQAPEVQVQEGSDVPRKMLDIPVTYPAFREVVRELESGPRRLDWHITTPRELLKAAIRIFSRDVVKQRQALDGQILQLQRERREIT